MTILATKFQHNRAGTYGGALYSLNQVLYISKSDFEDNIAGSLNDLFSNNAAAGGAVWYSSQDANSIITACRFIGEFLLSFS